MKAIISQQEVSGGRLYVTECAVTELIIPLDEVTLVHRGLDTSDHYCPDTDGHDTTDLRTIDRNDLADVLDIDIQCRENGLRLLTRLGNEILEKEGMLTLTV